MSQRLSIGAAVFLVAALLSVAVWSTLRDPIGSEVGTQSSTASDNETAVLHPAEAEARTARPAKEETLLANATASRLEAKRSGDTGAAIRRLGALAWKGRVLDGTRAAIAGARVTLLRRLGLEALLRQSGADPESVDIADLDKLQPLATVKSQRDGRFSLREVKGRSSATHLAVQHPDYALRLFSLASLAASAEKDIRLLLDPGRSLSGRVVDSQGVGIVGATLRIEATRAASGLGPKEAEFLASLIGEAKSGAAGRYSISGLPEGSYRVLGECSGYLAAHSRSFEIAQKDCVDCGNLVMRRARRLLGRVVDAQNKGIVGATIEIANEATTGRAMRAKSGSDGRFELVLPKHVPSFAIARHQNFNDARIDIRAPDGLGKLLVRMTPRASISGVVLDRSTNQAVEEFAIRARRLGDKEKAGAGSRAGTVANWTKHPKGQFSLGGLLPGRYVVEVHGKQHLFSQVGPIEIRSGSRTRRVSIALRRGVAIEGRARDASSDEGIAGVRIELFKVDGAAKGRRPQADDFRLLYAPASAARSERIRATRSGRGGRFSLGAHEPGRYRVVALAADRPRTTLDEFVVRGGQDKHQLRLAIAQGARVHGVVRNAAVTARATTASRSWVVLMHDDQRMHARRADNRGGFEFRGLPAGDYRAAVASSAAAGRSLLRGQRSGTRFRLEEGSSKRLELEQGSEGQVTGRVLVNGRPSSTSVRLLAIDSITRPAQIAGDRATRRLRADCDKAGNYVIDEVPAGTYALEVHSRSATAPQLLFETRVQVDSQGLWHPVHIKAGSFVFEVRDAAGAPVREAQLRLFREAPGSASEQSSPMTRNVEGPQRQRACRRASDGQLALPRQRCGWEHQDGHVLARRQHPTWPRPSLPPRKCKKSSVIADRVASPTQAFCHAAVGSAWARDRHS